MAEAYIFDVFGTCVDWRSSIALAVAVEFPDLDALAFADAWRAEYDPAMARIRAGDRGYVALDDLHVENLIIAARKFGRVCKDPSVLARSWERLDPWVDVVPGLTKLREGAIIAPCSNGSIALMTRLARYGGLPWDCILGADLAQDYKPKSAVYLACCAALRLPPEQVVMVAAHNADLAAAQAAGLRTAFVARPTEHGPDGANELDPTGDWDIVAADFNDLAARALPRG